jgi:hypothetical protein
MAAAPDGDMRILGMAGGEICAFANIFTGSLKRFQDRLHAYCCAPLRLGRNGFRSSSRAKIYRVFAQCSVEIPHIGCGTDDGFVFACG